MPIDKNAEEEDLREERRRRAYTDYDCPSCNTCWKLGQRLLPDPVRQILKG